MNKPDLKKEIPKLVDGAQRSPLCVGGDFYSIVPKDRDKNLEFRELLEHLGKHEETRMFLWEMCRRSQLFWLNAFCWVNEPRPDGDHGYGKLPFITWPAQDDAVRVAQANWGTSDIIVDKARGEGASWLFLMLMLHSWLFNSPDQIFNGVLASKDEKAVDDTSPDSLMWKLDFQLDNLPSWMAGAEGLDWVRLRSKSHTLINLSRKHTITGYAAGGDLATGGRATVMLWDEAAKFPPGNMRHALNSTEPVTNCRIFVSTHKGTANEFYKMVRNPGSTPLVVMDWMKNPARNKNMFRLSGNGEILHDTPELITPEEANEAWEAFLQSWPTYAEELDKKGFDWPEGKVVSPWYVSRCLRAGTSPQSMAQEYDRNPEGTEQQFFSEARLAAIRQSTVRPPAWRGYLRFDYDNPLGKVHFVSDPEGQVLVWTDFLPGTGSPFTKGEACIGCDIASGAGGSRTSNSVACAFDRETGEQILEFATNRLRPDQFAAYALAIAHWLGDGQLNWETNGSNGAAFTSAVKHHGYWNLYYREKKDAVSKMKTRAVGWGSAANTKADILGATEGGGLRGAIYEGDCVIRSEALLEECRQFVYDETGKVVHSGSMDKTDFANMREGHGDRVIAAAVAWLTVLDKPRGRGSRSKGGIDPLNPPRDTMAWRLLQHDRQQEAAESIEAYTW